MNIKIEKIPLLPPIFSFTWQRPDWSPDFFFFFFRLLLSNCLNWKIPCDDHSLLSELFLLRNEIIVTIRKKICTSPSSTVAPRSPRGCEKIFYLFFLIFFNLLHFYPVTRYSLLVTVLLCLVTPLIKNITIITGDKLQLQM